MGAVLVVKILPSIWSTRSNSSDLRLKNKIQGSKSNLKNRRRLIDSWRRSEQKNWAWMIRIRVRFNDGYRVNDR
jgi:hypothetical protein